MKRIILILILCLTLGFVSCSTDDYEESAPVEYCMYDRAKWLVPEYADCIYENYANGVHTYKIKSNCNDSIFEDIFCRIYGPYGVKDMIYDSDSGGIGSNDDALLYERNNHKYTITVKCKHKK